MIMGQIGEYRELTASEILESLLQRLANKQPIAIPEMFAELLGCLEDAAHWLHKLNQEFEKLYPDDMDPKDPAAPFWYAVAEATEPLKSVFDDVRAIKKYMPKETEASREKVP